jgi:hypothetical protein
VGCGADLHPTALARGHRWLAMLESGEAKSLKDIAGREGIDNSYVSRMVNLTTLAPDIVAAILDDALPNHISLIWQLIRQRCGVSSARESGSEVATPPQLNMPLRSLSIRNR